MADLLNEIAARSAAMAMVTRGIAPYTSTNTPDPRRLFWEHAQGDIDWLINDLKAARTVIEAVRPYIHDWLNGRPEIMQAIGEYDWRHDG